MHLDEPPKSVDIAIVGAGLAGLTLAAAIARCGLWSVALVEADAIVGGRARIEEQDGFLFDHGLHAVLYGERGALARAFKLLDLPLRIERGGVAFARGDKLIPFFDPRLTSFLHSPLLGLGEIARLTQAILQPIHGTAYYARSLSSWLQEHRASPALREILTGLSSAVMGLPDVENASAGAMFDFLRGAAQRLSYVGYPHGGWRSVLGPLAHAVETGARSSLHLSRPVRAVRSIDHTVTGLEFDGRGLDARMVVLAGPPSLLSLLPADLAPELRAMVAGSVPTRVVAVDLGLSTPIVREKRFIVLTDPPGVLFVPSNVAHEIAPPGKQIVQLIAPRQVSPEKDDAQALAILTARLRAAAERLFPGVTAATTVLRSRLLLHHGIALTTGQTHDVRLRSTGCARLEWIGDSAAQHGVGADIALESALALADRLSDPKALD